MAIVYLHTRLDTNEIFYVGIGSKERRAYRKDGRKKHWKNIVSKSNYKVDIIFKNISWEQACEIETFLIKTIGRKDLGEGPLVNFTNGGEGCFGRKVKESTKEKFLYKKISCYKKDGTYVQTFESLLEAAESLKLRNPCNISQCLTGSTKTAYGFQWKYGDKKEVKEFRIKAKKIEIEDVVKNEKTIYIDSLKINELKGIPLSSIRHCCNKGTLYNKRYKMSYIQ